MSATFERERGRVHLKWGAQHSISRILCKLTSHFKMANEWIEDDWGNASEILRIYHSGSPHSNFHNLQSSETSCLIALVFEGLDLCNAASRTSWKFTLQWLGK